jgi:hypothetical protein
MTDTTQTDLRPPRLYKYRSLADKGLEYFEDIVLKHRILWPSPSTFNDPYDCFPVIDLSGSDAELMCCAKAQVQRKFPSLSRQSRRQKEREIARSMRQRVIGSHNANEPEMSEWIKIIAETGVLCLTEDAVDLLMWGHYAQSHQGVCLEFDTQHAPFNLAHRISYDDERSVFRLFDPDRSSLMERILLRKAKAWEYEREWRIFGPGKVGFVEFPIDALTAIILGARISAKAEESVRKILASREKPISIRRVEIDSKTYILNSVDA